MSHTKIKGCSHIYVTPYSHELFYIFLKMKGCVVGYMVDPQKMHAICNPGAGESDMIWEEDLYRCN